MRTTSSCESSTSRSTWLVTVTGKASLPWRPFEPSRRRKRSSACSTGTSCACSSTRWSRSAERSKTAPRSAPTTGHEPLRLADRGREPGGRVGVVGPLAGEGVGGHDLHSERAEHERQHVRGAGEAVVDDDAEAAVAHGVGVDRREQLGRVRLAHPRGIRDAADLAGRDATELAAREVLLDLLLHRGAHLDSGRLEELDPDHLGVVRADADVEAGAVRLRLHEVARDGRRADAEIGDVDARRRDPGDHRPLDHAARCGALAAGDHARAPLQRGAERGGEPDRDIRRQVDVHHPRHPGLAEDARRAARLPDQALVQRRAGLDLLERIDPDAGQDHALGADRDLVADRGSLVHAHVRAQVAAAADDRPHDVGAAADVGGRVDDRADDAAALADGDARSRAPCTGRCARRARCGSSCRGTQAPRSRRDRRGPPRPPARRCRGSGSRRSRAARSRRARRSSPAGTGRGSRCPASSRRRRGRRSAGPSRAAAGRAPSRSRTAGPAGCASAPPARARRCRC